MLLFDTRLRCEDHRRISEETIRRGNWAVLLSLVLVQVIGWGFITLLSRGQWSDGFAYMVDNDAMPTWTFVIVQIVLGIALLFTFVFVQRNNITYSGRSILVVAAILRCIALLGEPIHESDFYRYLWDGKVANHGINPYRFEPGALFLYENGIEFEFPDKDTGVTWRGREFEAEEIELMEQLIRLRDENPTLFQRVSHPAVTTIYPPVAQAVFYLSNRIFGDSIFGMKLLFVGFDLGIILLIQMILPLMKRSSSWVLLYAWNPLPIKEIANSCHYDVVAVFFVLLALWIALRNGAARNKAIGVAVALALGTLTKYFAVLLLPVLLIAVARRENASESELSLSASLRPIAKAPEVWMGLAIFSFICALGFYPYLLWNDAGFTEIFRGLFSYNKHWVYSPGLFGLIHLAVGWFTDEPMIAAKLIAALLLSLTVLVAALQIHRNPASRCFLVMAALFVLIPTAFPWYFCWVLALVPFQNRFSWLALGLLLPINYVDFHSPGDTALSQLTLHGFHATQILIWLGFFLCWLVETAVPKQRP